MLLASGLILGMIAVAEMLGRGDTGADAQGVPSVSSTGSLSPSPSPTSSPSPSGSPSPSPSVQPAETAEEFFARFSAALRSGKIAFQLARLHPFVFDRYAETDCRAYFGGLELPDYAVEVLETGKAMEFVWETDDLRRTIPKATTVRVRLTEDGDTFVETDTHLVLRDGKYLFLSDCGSPKEGAR